MTVQRRPIRSIDGILPPHQADLAKPRRSVYISNDKHEPSAPARKFMSLQPRAAIDGVLPPPRRNHASAAPAAPVRKPIFTLPENTDVVMRLPRSRSLRARLSSVLQYFALAGIALAAAYSTGIGQYFVLAYALVALVLRRSSALSFGIALLLLVSIPVFQVLNQSGIANNMAVYVYELLVVGTLQAIIELRWPPKSKKEP